MPAFTSLSDDQLTALVHFVVGIQDKEESPRRGTSPRAKYRFTGYDKFLDPDGYPAVVPPWGTLNAINLDTGEYVWKIPFGEYPELAATRYEEYRHGELWRAGGYGRWIGLYRSDQLRQEIPRLR